MKNSLKLKQLSCVIAIIFISTLYSCREEAMDQKTIEKNSQNFAFFDENATVTYKFEHDKTIPKNRVKLIIGGAEANLNSNKVKGVEIFSSGEIFVNVQVEEGFGNYKLHLKKVVSSVNNKTYETTPNPGDNVHVNGNTNTSKNLTYNLKE